MPRSGEGQFKPTQLIDGCHQLNIEQKLKLGAGVNVVQNQAG